MKKKIKMYLLCGLLAVLPFLLVIILVYAGIIAVVSVADSTENIVGEHPTSDVLWHAVQNEDVITDDMLAGWMVDRASLNRLFKNITQYNNRPAKSRSYSVEAEKKWIKEKREIRKIKDGDTYIEAEFVSRTSQKQKVYVGTTIKEDQGLIKQYPVDWQLAYLFCVYDVIDEGYSDTDEETGEEITISRAKIEDVIESLKPEFVFEFDPFEEWKDGARLKMAEVESHPHRTHSYFSYDSSPEVYNGSVEWFYHTPLRVIDKVIMPWKIVDYTMRSDGSYERVTIYDAERIIRIHEAYAGERNMKMFLEALDYLPGGQRIADEIRRALMESGHEDLLQ